MNNVDGSVMNDFNRISLAVKITIPVLRELGRVWDHKDTFTASIGITPCNVDKDVVGVIYDMMSCYVGDNHILDLSFTMNNKKMIDGIEIKINCKLTNLIIGPWPQSGKELPGYIPPSTSTPPPPKRSI